MVHFIWTISDSSLSYHKDFGERFFMQRVPFALVLHKKWCHTIEYTSDALKNPFIFEYVLNPHQL